MEKVNKIRAICDVDFLKSPHCVYLSDDQKSEILKDYAQKTCLVVGFVLDDRELFVAVFNLRKDSLHVTEVVGSFGRYIRELDIYSKFLAATCGYKQVTFCSKRRAIIEQWAPKMGYEPVKEIHHEFVKRVQ